MTWTTPICTLSHERDLITFCESGVRWKRNGIVNLIFKHNIKISQVNGDFDDVIGVESRKVLQSTSRCFLTEL